MANAAYTQIKEAWTLLPLYVAPHRKPTRRHFEKTQALAEKVYLLFELRRAQTREIWWAPIDRTPMDVLDRLEDGSPMPDAESRLPHYAALKELKDSAVNAIRGPSPPTQQADAEDDEIVRQAREERERDELLVDGENIPPAEHGETGGYTSNMSQSW